MEGFSTATTSKVYEDPLENYTEGMGSDIGLVNHEKFDVISILESLYGEEINENQR